MRHAIPRVRGVLLFPNDLKRSNNMKRLIVAAALAALAVPAFAVETGKPFEQTELDRALPQITGPPPPQITAPAPAQSSVASASLPYEQAEVDRMLPTFDTGRADSAVASGSQSPWANDQTFIAPPRSEEH